MRPTHRLNTKSIKRASACTKRVQKGCAAPGSLRDYQQAQLDAATLAAYHRKVAEEMGSGLGASAAQTPAASVKGQ